MTAEEIRAIFNFKTPGFDPMGNESCSLATAVAFGEIAAQLAELNANLKNILVVGLHVKATE